MNSINFIEPYQVNGIWVFDDPDKGLSREPFVDTTGAIIDHLTKNMSDAEDGFILFFSSSPFPDYQEKFTWYSNDHNGNWYYNSMLGMKGWLCPALLKYFDTPPQELFVQAIEK